jgi:hypothetical protein
MNKAIDILRKPRLQVLNDTAGFSLEQLNHIPAGFKNNIIWNLGHIVAAQQGVCYARAGLEKIISDEFFLTFKPETKPERLYEMADFENIKSLMMSTLDRLEEDLDRDIFGNYKTWTTRYGVEITNINDAVHFLPFHEGLHAGYIMSLRKLV